MTASASQASTSAPTSSAAAPADDKLASPPNVTASELMQREVRVVGPELPLPDLDRAFLDAKVSGFPVVDDNRLVGIVSRSDVVQQLCVEQSWSEAISDYFRASDQYDVDARGSLQSIGERMGRRLEALRVKDVMTRKIISVTPDTPLREVAGTLLESNIHRLLVVEAGRLLGVISTLDVIAHIASGAVTGIPGEP